MSNLSTGYGRAFFELEDSELSGSAPVLVALALELCKPRSVVDVGCGTGRLLTEFQTAGVSEVLGIEGPWVDPSTLHLAKEQVKILDLTRPFSLGRRFDLAVCLEVGEHLPPKSARSLVSSLVQHSDLILFSAAIPFQGGRQHVNEQWPQYWARLFAECDYLPIDAIRPRVWSDDRVAYCYRQNLLVYVRRSEIARFPALESAPRLATGSSPLPLVHPDRHLETYTTWRGLTYSLMLGLLHLTGLRRSAAIETDSSDQNAEK